MKKRIGFLFVLAATVAATAAIFGGSTASADPGNGATVTHIANAGYCNVTDLHAFSYQYYFLCTIQSVKTGGPSGQVNESLRGTVDPNFSSPLPTKAMDVSTAVTGELCDFSSLGVLVTTQGTITPSGQVSLTCRLAGN